MLKVYAGSGGGRSGGNSNGGIGDNGAGPTAPARRGTGMSAAEYRSTMRNVAREQYRGNQQTNGRRQSRG